MNAVSPRSLVFVMMVVLTFHHLGAAAENDQAIRKLAVTVDPLQAATLPGTPGTTEFRSTNEVEKSLGKDIAKQFAGQIEFAKELLVHVAWGSPGPPFGELKYEVNDTKDGKTITFFVQEPKVNQRGMAYRLGNDFFAVPKTAKV